MRYAIYALIDPRTDEIKYIGLSFNPEQRFKAHLRKCQLTRQIHKKYSPSRNRLSDWLSQLAFADVEPVMRIIWYVKANSSREAKTFERHIIRSYAKKHKLVNSAHLPMDYHYNVSLKRVSA